MKEKLIAAFCKLLENLGELFKVKTLITLTVIYVFARLALSSGIQIEAKDVISVALMIITFYFTKREDKRS